MGKHKTSVLVQPLQVAVTTQTTAVAASVVDSERNDGGPKLPGKRNNLDQHLSPNTLPLELFINVNISHVKLYLSIVEVFRKSLSVKLKIDLPNRDTVLKKSQGFGYLNKRDGRYWSWLHRSGVMVFTAMAVQLVSGRLRVDQAGFGVYRQWPGKILQCLRNAAKCKARYIALVKALDGGVYGHAVQPAPRYGGRLTDVEFAGFAFKNRYVGWVHEAGWLNNGNPFVCSSVPSGKP